jgi:hypothetical protein
MKVLSVALVFAALIALYYLAVIFFMLRKAEKKITGELKQAEVKQLNPMNVRSVGTAEVARPKVSIQLCPGCGRAPFLHESEDEYNVCKGK